MLIKMKTTPLMLIFAGFFIAILSARAGAQGEIVFKNQDLPLYPELLARRPDIPSPYISEDGEEYVVAVTKDQCFTIIPVTLENVEPWGYSTGDVRKGRQLEVDAEDFPSLAETGQHADSELDRTKAITGKSIAEITHIARPGKYSRAGFMAHDEDIISVLVGDNRLVRQLGLTHPEVVRPLFHVWNLVLAGIDNGKWTDEAMNIEAMYYNNWKIHLTFSGRGWQESIFNDEIQGAYHLEMWRELSAEEEKMLREAYPGLGEEKKAEMRRTLSHIHTGEMVPYYAMWYGFYEGHSGFRADPIALAFIFGLRSGGDIIRAFPDGLYEALHDHFVSTVYDPSPPPAPQQPVNYQNETDALLKSIRTAGGHNLSAHESLDSRQVLELLLEALKDERWSIRREAAEALAAVDEERILAPLIDRLGDDEPRVGEAAAAKLATMGEIASGPLIAALKSEKSIIRMRAASILGKIGTKNAVAPLFELLRDSDRMVADEATLALSRIHHAATDAILREALRDSNDYVRQSAGWILETRKYTPKNGGHERRDHHPGGKEL